MPYGAHHVPEQNRISPCQCKLPFLLLAQTFGGVQLRLCPHIPECFAGACVARDFSRQGPWVANSPLSLLILMESPRSCHDYFVRHTGCTLTHIHKCRYISNSVHGSLPETEGGTAQRLHATGSPAAAAHAPAAGSRVPVFVWPGPCHELGVSSPDSPRFSRTLATTA